MSIGADKISAARLITRVCCRMERLQLLALRQAFHFDRWHVSGAYSCRSYKAVVVELARALNPEAVVELGCGLGDILSRVPAKLRIGVDSDLAAIRAARFLRPRAARWLHGDATSVAAAIPGDLVIDCLIMVNWIHNLSPQHLASCITPLLGRTRYLLLDSIDPDGPSSYRYKHDFAFLSGCTERVSATPVPSEHRTFTVFRVTR